MPTIGNLTAASDAQVAAIDSLVPLENAAHNATVKGTVLQGIRGWLRPSNLDVVATNLVTDAAVVVVEDATLAAPVNRQISITQLRAIMSARVGQVWEFANRSKAGATAGWVVAAGDNLSKLATLPASQAGSTLVIPIGPFKAGWVITGFAVNGSLQSGGNHATLLADLRALTNAVAGATDASVGVMAAALDVVANTVASAANATKTGLTETVIAGKSYYILITSTTGAACTEEVNSIDVTVNEV